MALDINKHGEEKAFKLACKAREQGLKSIELKSSTLFSPPTPRTIKIWRYMDFTKFIEILEHDALFFPKVDLFEDQFEGSYSRGNTKLREFVYSRSEKKKDIDASITQIKKIRKYIVVNCWHMSPYESAAMWKLYALSNESICIQTTYKKLRWCLDKDVKIGMVKYIDYNKSWIPESNIYYPFFYKRKSFEHERELRAIQNLSNEVIEDIFLKDELKKGGIWKKVKLNNLIQNIYLPPNCTNWFYDLVKKVVKRYGLTCIRQC